VDVLAGIFAAALLQDLSYTSKTVLVTSSLYLILTASVTLRSGLSFATLEAFAAIAVGGACGTIGGMFAVEWVERHLTLNTPISSRPGNRRQDYRRWVSTWLSFRQIRVGDQV
jgi:spore maturation protein SpmA